MTYVALSSVPNIIYPPSAKSYSTADYVQCLFCEARYCGRRKMSWPCAAKWGHGSNYRRINEGEGRKDIGRARRPGVAAAGA